MALACRFKQPNKSRASKRPAKCARFFIPAKALSWSMPASHRNDAPRVLPLRDGHAIKERFIAAFGIDFHLRMILSENRYPLFGIMR